MGGEKLLKASAELNSEGSPPRGRGKVVSKLFQFCYKRITPAWAGKSDIYETLGTDPEDHPRVGGEKSTQRRRSSACSGSPPRGRGKEILQLEGVGVLGITPAWAGKSLAVCEGQGLCGDHPRVGGEK